MSTRRWVVGEVVGSMIEAPTSTSLFLFSAATWNPHRIHYDVEFARAEGHPDLVVPGPLIGAWMTRVVEDAAGGRWVVTELAFRNTRIMTVGSVITIDARVTSVGDLAAVIDLVGVVGGVEVATGRAMLTRSVG